MMLSIEDVVDEEAAMIKILRLIMKIFFSTRCLKEMGKYFRPTYFKTVTKINK